MGIALVPPARCRVRITLQTRGSAAPGSAHLSRAHPRLACAPEKRAMTAQTDSRAELLRPRPRSSVATPAPRRRPSLPHRARSSADARAPGSGPRSERRSGRLVNLSAGRGVRHARVCPRGAGGRSLDMRGRPACPRRTRAPPAGAHTRRGDSCAREMSSARCSGEASRSAAEAGVARATGKPRPGPGPPSRRLRARAS